jgi:hypothetical protein
LEGHFSAATTSIMMNLLKQYYMSKHLPQKKNPNRQRQPIMANRNEKIGHKVVILNTSGCCSQESDMRSEGG